MSRARHLHNQGARKRTKVIICSLLICIRPAQGCCWQSFPWSEIIPQVPLFHMVAYARVGKRINFKPNLATVMEIPLAQITFKR